jgi:ADP-heptose:LPS heptosyltransferase/predicted SAM-dependent methyltransferase
MWRPDIPEGNEALKVRWDIVPYTSWRGLDLGCGPQKPFAHFIGVDNGHHKVFGYDIRPDVQAEADDLSVFGSRSMDFVFSSHLLEHMEDTEATLREWWRVIKIGGYLVLYLPHKAYYPNIGQPGSNSDHRHDFLPADIVTVMEKVGGWTLMVNEDRTEGDEYSFFQVYRKEAGKQHSVAPKIGQKTCAVIRYGAFGDLMMASSIFPLLKAQGYHVTLYTTPTGEEVVRHDPNIDRIIVQDKDQVPNHQLVEFWSHLEKKYDKFINLSESVEGVLLALPGRSNHRWPQPLRHKYLNHNYLEFTHELSGVDGELRQRFYPTAEERAWARTQRDRMGKFVIMWSLAGSSVHKTWPYLDEIIARTLIEYPHVEFVLVGDAACQMLEAGWEEEKRVHLRSGKWSIRQSLTFTEFADLMIGPETGVLNAAANLPVKKIITLSHSSVENLTKHWINTFSLVPKNTACYPCHQLHTGGFEHCARDERTGCAACQADISPEQMWEVMVPVLERRNLEQHFAANYAEAAA